MTLFRLLQAMEGVNAAVVSLTGEGSIGARIRALGTPVTALGLNDRRHALVALRRLRRVIEDLGPDVVQGWMYHGNIAAYWARGVWRPCAGLAWGIRQSLAGCRQEKVTTRAVIRLGAWLSGRVDAIVYNAERSAGEHEARGYDGRRRMVIANGIDCAVFRPEPDRRAALRRALRIDSRPLLIGHVARYHPMKGHRVLLRALEALRRNGIDAQALMIGRGIGRENRGALGAMRTLRVGWGCPPPWRAHGYFKSVAGRGHRGLAVRVGRGLSDGSG